MSGYAYQWAKRQLVGDSSAKTLLKTYANWAAEDYTTWVTNEELLLDTELNIETIRKARKKLIALGYLAETKKRIGETRSIIVYQMLAPEGATVVQSVDQKGNTISLSPPTKAEFEAKPLGKRSPSKSRPSSKPLEKPSPSESEAPRNPELSPTGSRAKPLEIPSQAPRNPEPNKAEVYGESRDSSAAREADAVENSAAAADSKDEPPNTELELTDLLIALEAERGKTLTIDRNRDRTHVLTWVGKGVTAEQLRAAHRLAAAARKRDRDERPTFAGFVSTFLDELLADAARPAPPSAPPSATADVAWYETADGVEARGAELGQRPRKPDEDWRYYRVLVVRAANDRRAADFVLSDATRFNALDLYQFARATFGAALMPVDDYAS